MLNLLSILLLTIIQAKPEPKPLFHKAKLPSPIAFNHTCGSKEKDWIYEVNGSGIALLDYDGDGDLDIYFVNGSKLDLKEDDEKPKNALYRNDGNWKFTDITTQAGVGDTGWGCGVAIADIENDGDLDIYVANLGANVLYLNQGDGTFKKAENSGTESLSNSSSASFGDFNRDGFVDLYVANYVPFKLDPEKSRLSGKCEYKGRKIFCGPGGYPGQADQLFLNRGEGKFEDVSKAWRIQSSKPSFGLGVLVVDIQDDGFPDILVANDTNPNFCFLNQSGKSFTEAAQFLGIAYNDYGVPQAGMGLASGDFRGLGLEDLFVTNFEDDTNTLYLKNPNAPFYTEGTHIAGLGGASYPYMGWGTFGFDADGDADLDLFVANGHIAPQVKGLRNSPGYEQKNQLFLNDGKGKFREYSPKADSADGLSIKKSSRGAAFGDLDGDGDPDIVVSNIDSAPTLLNNRSSGRKWISVELEGERSNKFGIGAKVSLIEATGQQLRTIQSGRSYASQGELYARFSRRNPATVAQLVVAWPSGLKEAFEVKKQEKSPHIRLSLKEGTGKPVSQVRKN